MKNIYYSITIGLMLFSATTLIAQPTNDNCSGAQNLGTLPAPAACGNNTTATKSGTPVTVSGTNVSATPSNPYPYINTCAPANLQAPPDDVWYSFVASSYQAKIAITAATFTNPVITVWEGSCSNLSGIGCVVGAANAATLTIYALTPGHTYYVQVSGEDSTQTGTYTLTLTSQTDCANCLVASTTTATPPPVNGTYAPGTTVTFCDSIYGWNQTSSNWLHGVVPTFGPGWNLSTLVIGTEPSSCSQDGGHWAWYPGGDTSSHNGSIWGAGFYYETTSGSTSGILDGNPGNNYGDDDINNCSWKFCVTLTTNSGTCTPGVNLDVTFSASGDGQSGSWTSTACQHDPVTDIYVVGSCCPPTMSSTPVSCANPNGGTATATPTGTYSPWTFAWSNGVTQTLSGPSTITGLSAGIDTVTVTDATNCTVTAVVTIGSTSQNGGPNQTVSCLSSLPGGTATMAGTGTGIWTSLSTNPGTSIITHPTDSATTITTFSAPGIYKFRWSNGACSDTVTVTVTAAPTPTVNSVSICPGDTATLTATGGVGYVWNTTATTSSISVHPANTTSYTVTATNSSGCTATASGTVTINSAPTPTVNNPSICAGGTATLTATGGVSYIWSTTATTASINVSPTTTTTYRVTVTNAAGCTATASGTVTVSPAPTVSVNDTSVCPGSPATLTATPSASGGTYLWAPGGATTQSITVSPTTATTYTVIYLISGCTPAVDTGRILINTLPAPTVNDAVVCQGFSATLTATGGVSYIWNTTATTPGITVSPATTTTYTVTATGANGCTAAASGTVTVNNPPNPTVNNASICTGGTAVLTASGGVSYVWSTTATTPSITVSPVIPTTYTVTATDANGCTAATTATVTITTPPTLTVSDTAICSGTSGTIYATPSIGGGSYVWAPGLATTQSITVSPTTTTTYTVAYTISGCPPAIDSGTVTISPAPDAGPNDTVCLNATASLNAIGTGSWTALVTNPANTTITSPTTALTTITGFSVAGTYTYIWTVNSCTATVSVVVNAPPAVSTTSVNISCTNPTGVITANPSGVSPFSYQWSTSGTNDTINTTSAGTQYTVTVTDKNQCTGTATGSVSNLIVTLGVIGTPTSVACYGDSNGRIILSITPAGQYTYTWSGTSQATDSIYDLVIGNYSVTVTDSNGCSATAGPFTITQPTLDSLVVTPVDTLITLGDTVQLNSALTGAYPGASYLWIPSTGLSCDTCLNPLLVPIDTNADVYKLIVTYNNDCSVSDSLIVTAKPNDLIGIPTAFTPNGDGKNDTFYIPATGVKSFKMNIYDRWGGQVFSTNDINSGWDGTYKGKPEPSEAYMYFFTLVYLDGKTVTHEGTFMLLR